MKNSTSESSLSPHGHSDWTYELCSVSDWIRFSISEMHRGGCVLGQGCQDWLDEARWLVLSSLSLPIDLEDPSLLGARLTLQERQRLAAALRRRTADREPTAYILQEAWLRGFRFKSDARAIIPRSFLAKWLSPVDLPNIEDTNAPLRVLDLCTGSGCLAVLAALHLPNARVWATDISNDALGLAAENISAFSLESRITLLVGDGLQALETLKPKITFDLIVCNPPYVNSASYWQLPPEFKAEPGLAHHGGEDGMQFIKTLLQGYGALLAHDGCLLLEIGHELLEFNRLVNEGPFKQLPITWLETESGEQAVVRLEHPQRSY